MSHKRSITDSARRDRGALLIQNSNCRYVATFSKDEANTAFCRLSSLVHTYRHSFCSTMWFKCSYCLCGYNFKHSEQRLHASVAAAIGSYCASTIVLLCACIICRRQLTQPILPSTWGSSENYASLIVSTQFFLPVHHCIHLLGLAWMTLCKVRSLLIFDAVISRHGWSFHFVNSLHERYKSKIVSQHYILELLSYLLISELMEGGALSVCRFCS